MNILLGIPLGNMFDLISCKQIFGTEWKKIQLEI